MEIFEGQLSENREMLSHVEERDVVSLHTSSNCESIVISGLASELEMRKLYSTQELMDFEQKKLDWDSNKVNEKKRCAGWTWWVPATWASRLVRDAYDRGYIDSHENVTYVYEVSSHSTYTMLHS